MAVAPPLPRGAREVYMNGGNGCLPNSTFDSQQIRAIPIYSQNDSVIRHPSSLRGRGGGHFLAMGYWGCAAEWGLIFTTGMTIMGSFQAGPTTRNTFISQVQLVF